MTIKNDQPPLTNDELDRLSVVIEFFDLPLWQRDQVEAAIADLRAANTRVEQLIAALESRQ